jgi:hypothetical protein
LSASTTIAVAFVNSPPAETRPLYENLRADVSTISDSLKASLPHVPLSITLSPPGRRVVKSGSYPRQWQFDPAQRVSLTQLTRPQQHILGSGTSEERRSARISVLLDKK